jgi:hypothetical protein
MTTAEAGSSAFSSTVVAQYETLRSAMLGGVLPPAARSGLIVFLQQGMWRWARMLATQAYARPDTPSPCLTPAEPCEHRNIVYVFARMAMTINDRRAP